VVSTLKSFRLPVVLLARIDAIAKTKRVKFSAAVRFALERGVAAIEREGKPEQEPPPAEMPRRRVLSRGL
jgi:hypothetical protein